MSGKNVPMLQEHMDKAASPTKLGKEIFVFVERIENQIKLLNNIPFSTNLKQSKFHRSCILPRI